MWWGRVGFSFFLGQHTAAPVLTGSTRVHLPKSFLGKQLDNCTQEIWCFSSTSTVIIMVAALFLLAALLAPASAQIFRLPDADSCQKSRFATPRN